MARKPEATTVGESEPRSASRSRAGRGAERAGLAEHVEPAGQAGRARSARHADRAGLIEQAGPDGEPRWLTADERAAWFALAGLVTRLPAALDAQLQRDAGISFFEYMVMAVLSEQPDRSMQMSDIARGASASLSRLSHTAKRLEKQGYLKRARCPGAGRRTRATLTRAGYEKVVATAPGHVATVRRLLVDAVTPAQLEAVRQVGQTVLTRIDPHERCVPPA